MQQQVVLVATSGADAHISAWDLATGTQLTNYKGNASPRNGLCCVGRDYLCAAQTAKDALHFWAWHKDQVLQKSYVVEKLTAVAASPDGVYLAAGGNSGTLYVWELSTGRLLRSWPAHYKAVSCLAFLEAGGILVSGGEDTLANVWVLADVLDAAADWSSNPRVSPFQSWSEHTLPVTAVCCGAGEANAVIATASLDRTVKLWRLATGALLRSVQLPSGVTALALDAGEHSLFAGTSEGVVYEIDLLHGDTAAGGAAGGSLLPNLASTSAAGAGAGMGAGLGSSGGAGGGSAGALPSAMEGHTKAVNSLAVSADGERLVSASDDGSVRVWDVRSRQQLRCVKTHNNAPASCALLVPWPEHLTPGGASAQGGERKGPKRPLPLASLAKYPGFGGGLKAWEGPPVVLDGAAWSGNSIARAAGVCAPPQLGTFDLLLTAPSLSGGAASAGPGPASAAADGGEGSGDLAAARAEAAALRQQLAAATAAAEEWKAMHGELQRMCAEQLASG